MNVRKYYDNENGVEPPYYNSTIGLEAAMSLLATSKSDGFGLEKANANIIRLVKLVTSRPHRPLVIIHHIIEISGDFESIQTLIDNW